MGELMRGRDAGLDGAAGEEDGGRCITSSSEELTAIGEPERPLRDVLDAVRPNEDSLEGSRVALLELAW